MLAELEPLASSYGAYVFVVVLGLLWGSFANVCIYRWAPSKEYPKGRSVVAPGSHCFTCKAPVRWYDNVPLLSWVWLRGKCRSCRAPFSPRYLIVEALVGALFGVAWWIHVAAGALFEPFEDRLIRFAVSCAFCFTMVVIAFIDLDTKRIVHRVWSVLVFYGLSLAIGQPWWVGLVGAAIGFGLPWAISEIYIIVTEREGLGLGDAIVLAIVGALLGWRGVVASLFVGSLTGSIIGVFALVRGEPPKGGQARSRASAFVSIGAVAATVLATISGLRGSYVIAGISCVAALACLVISRRLEPPPIDDEAESETTGDGAHHSDEAVPRRTPAVLAMSSAVALVGGVVLVLLRYPAAAATSAGVGLVLLVVARRLFYGPEGPEYVDSSEEDAPPADAPSLMRTEVPFGPFLAIGAVFYLFAAPWIVVQFSLL